MMPAILNALDLPSLTGLLLLFALLALILKLLRPSKKELDLETAYTQRPEFLTPAERTFYGVLCQAVEQEHILIFAKVRIADVLTPINGLEPSDRWSALTRISSKHFDFLLVDRTTLTPLAAIELDDASHQTKRAQKSDAVKNVACRSSDFPLIRVTARKTYAIATIAEKIQEALSQENVLR